MEFSISKQEGERKQHGVDKEEWGSIQIVGHEGKIGTRKKREINKLYSSFLKARQALTGSPQTETPDWVVMSNYCKYKLLEISRLLSHADLHTIELSITFNQVMHLSCNTSRIVLMQASGMFQNTLWIHVKTHLCCSRGSCRYRIDDCFENYTEREYLRKIAHFKELWREQWDCVGGELGYKLWWA